MYTGTRNYDRIMAMEPMEDAHFKCPTSILKAARDQGVNISGAAREGVIARTYGGVLVTAGWYRQTSDAYGGDPDARALGAASLVMPSVNGHVTASDTQQDQEPRARIEQLVTAYHEQHQDQQRELSNRLDDLERRQLEARDHAGPDWMKALAAFAVLILALAAAGGFIIGYRMATSTA